jgi:O-antigen ligase
MNGIVSAAAKATVEGFVGLQSSEKRRDAYVDFFSVVIAFVIALILLSFVGKWLWNTVVVDLIGFAKPARSFWQILGLMIFMSLIRP